MLELNKDSYVLNRRTKKCFKISTGKIQTRNRYQMRDMRNRSLDEFRFVVNKIVPITKSQANMCRKAEKIIRSHKKMSVNEKQFMKAYRNKCKEILKG